LRNIIKDCMVECGLAIVSEQYNDVS
jgi:hypothetical protein